jgi:ketosteroid isomerase-like protein
MSQENVEIVRQAYEAFNRRDSEGMVADFADGFEYVSTGALPDARGVYRGPEGWTDFVGWLRSEFESPRVEINDLSEAGDQVLAAVTLRGRGKQSGVDTSWDVWHLWTVQDSKLARGHGFTSKTDALEAAGLRE